MQERVYKTLVCNTNDIKQKKRKDTISGVHVSPSSAEMLGEVG